MARYAVAIKELAIANGDENIYRLAKRLGVSDSRASQLWNGHNLTRLGLETIGLICEAYNCTPNDFIKPTAAPAKAASRTPRKSAARPKPS